MRLKCGQRVFFIGGAKNHCGRWIKAGKVQCGFQAIHHRHTNIEQHQINRRRHRNFKCARAVLGFKHVLNIVVRFQQFAQAGARKRFVVYDQGLHCV